MVGFGLVLGISFIATMRQRISRRYIDVRPEPAQAAGAPPGLLRESGSAGS